MLGFEHMRVVEVGTAVSIPMVGAVLANLGAEVIKVESRRRLDINRARVPRSVTDAAPTSQEEVFPLLHDLNPGKKSVTLDLKSLAGQQLFHELLDTADVFIENYAPGWLDRLGMPLNTLLEQHPQLILLAASAYGEDGPYSQQRAYAPIMTGLAGLEGLVGYGQDDVVGMVATAYSDPNAAYFGVLAVLAALLERDRGDGRGCLIDLSQTEAATCLVGIALAEHQLFGDEVTPRGNEHPCHTPHDIYPCAGRDRWVALAVTSDKEWARLTHALEELPELRDPRFAAAEDRRGARAEIDELVSTWTRGRSVNDVVARLVAHRVPVAPVLAPEDLETTEPFIARELTEDVVHPVLGPMTITATPWRFGADRPRPSGAGPMLGSANGEVIGPLLGGDGTRYEQFDADGAFY